MDRYRMLGMLWKPEKKTRVIFFKSCVASTLTLTQISSSTYQQTKWRGNRFESYVSCRLIFITKRFYSNALFNTNLQTDTGATPGNISGRGDVSWRICSISKDWGRWLGTTLKVNSHPYPLFFSVMKLKAILPDYTYLNVF